MPEKMEDVTSPQAQESRETPRVIEVTAEELKKANFDPNRIGQSVLGKFGYGVVTESSGYNSLGITVTDNNGKVVYNEVIG